MNTNNHRLGFVAWTVLALSLAVRCAAAGSEQYVASQLRTGDSWGAQRWTADDLALFGGEPKVSGDTSGHLLVRYSYYVSDYDTVNDLPVWVAHIDTDKSAEAAASRKGSKWDRSKYQFKPDENIVTYSTAHNIAWVTNSDYTNANPSSFKPVTAKNRLTRGHMASNLEMKGEGATDDEGVQSQRESFSFANVCPQFQGHNAPLWSTLEQDCLELAQKVGRVAVLSGPIKSDEDEVVTTDAKKGQCHIPIPKAFYKVIIARVNNHLEALAIVAPHSADVKADQLFDYVVSVRKVEKLTGINFMPDQGANDEVEDHPSEELLDILQQS